jgi:hypothetical protein
MSGGRRLNKRRRSLLKALFWIGVVLIRIRISILMPFQIRIWNGIKTMTIHMRILSKVLHMLENHNFVYIHLQQCLSTTLVYPSRQRRRLIAVIDTDPDQPDPGPWMLIPIRQNVADPTGSGSGKMFRIRPDSD